MLLSQKIKIYKDYSKELIKLGIPIFIGNISQMLIGVGDVYVAGKHSTLTLGAISVSTAIFMTILISAIGFLVSISPVISNMRGQRKTTKTLLKTTISYSFIISFICFLIFRIILKYLSLIGLSPDIYQLVYDYIDIAGWGIFGGLLFCALREFLQAYEIVRFPNFLIFIQIFLNLFLNFAFVFGLFGFPQTGANGLAISSTIVRTFGGAALLLYCMPFLKGKGAHIKNYVKDILKTGAPISIALFIEFLGFNVSAVLLGTFSATLSAAHNIIITLISLAYTLPFSISNALSVKVGFLNGKGNYLSIKRYTLSAHYLMLMCVICTTSAFIFFGKNLTELFSKDINVINSTIPVMSLVSCFLLFDGIQCINGGTLKGLKETKPIAFIMAFSYILISIPLGCILAYKYNIVLKGFWTGLSLALLFAAITSTFILIYKLKKKMA